MKYIAAIDQGTTSSRCIIFDETMRVVSMAQRALPQIFPSSGLVEHDPEAIWQSVLATAQEAMADAGGDIAAIGITNQRETALLWDAETGAVLHNAIVWQDRRTADLCATMREQGLEADITRRTGLLLDPYFSAAKLRWLLDRYDKTRRRAGRGKILFGTVDSFLIWRLTGGKVHATDATNASRTMLYNIRTRCWDEDMCALFGVPLAMLPEVKECAADYGVSETSLFGRALPILGVAGDQQAAVIGQACFAEGMIKATYGTGCFMLLNTGQNPIASKNRLLTTIAYQLDGQTHYALEGSIFIAGAVIGWLRGALKIIHRPADADTLAAQAADDSQVILVPAFTGLGAPYWDSECLGAIYGLRLNTGRAELARAALESAAYQTRDLLEAMRADLSSAAENILRADGGMSVSDWTMQSIADITGAPVDRSSMREATALGAAWLAGMCAGVYPAAKEFAARWTLERRFSPSLSAGEREKKYARWQQAVKQTRFRSD